MMASPSSATSPNYRFDVFPSFHGPDVREGFLSHLRKQFKLNNIKMFNDQGIEKSQMISSSLTRAIRESRISIVILSKKYASSSWCLYELLEILECKEVLGQTVMTIFYGVDASDVQNQTGDFGRAFNETCASKMDEKWKWSQALTYVGKIQGQSFQNWDNEANMIEKIARHVLNQPHPMPCRDFDAMVGLEAHLRKIQSLLDLDNDEVKMVGIFGHVGIGKSTIARALHSRFSNRFQLTCFVDNLWLHSCFDEYGLKLRLQEIFLTKLLNKNGMRIHHLGAIKDYLSDQNVLIILDDVRDLKHLEALANDTAWFGPGSRIVVTTESRVLLQQHGINNTYHVGFPSREEALEILCRYAFRQRFPHHGFKELALRALKLCGNLPLGLRVVGSSLRGKNEEEWEDVLHRLHTILDRDIDDVLRVGFENLFEDEQSLVLHIAVFFNYKDAYIVKAMFADSHLDVKYGLSTLVDNSVVYTSTNGKIVMHKLLQQMSRQAIHRQDPWKREILIDAMEILDVLECDSGTRAVRGISFDISEIDEIYISERAFKRLPNLQFLYVYKSRSHGKDKVHIPEEIKFPFRLRLLHWEAYPRQSLPPTFHPAYLVELNLQHSELEMLWQGTQPLTNLKKMDLSYSQRLKELPDLSDARNLEILQLNGCESLVELPSSIVNLQRLEDLSMQFCIKLEVVPININLASLERINMAGCSRLRSFPDISTNIVQLFLSGSAVEEVPASIRLWSRLSRVDISYTDIKEMPDCIKGLQGFEELNLSGCKKLASLPELPCSLAFLMADDCESLERVTYPLDTPNAQLNFTNCFKLSREARRLIIQRSFLDGLACLPGSVMPSEFNNRARGNSLTIGPFSASSRFEACVVISPDQHNQTIKDICYGLRYRIIGKSGDVIYKNPVSVVPPGEPHGIRTKHLCIFHCELPENEICLEVGIEVLFELSNSACNPLDDCEIIECGVRILTNESESSGDRGKISELDEDSEWSYKFEPREDVLEDSEEELLTSEASQDSDQTTDGLFSDSISENANEHTYCWSWLSLCNDLSDFVRNMEV